MDKDSINDLFSDLDTSTKQWLKYDHKELMMQVIKDINKNINKVDILCPEPKKIFNAFRFCPKDKIRIVLLGQDPYPNPLNAMGLSFSVHKSIPIPQSLKNIFKCLVHHKLIRNVPPHGDLTKWASQGILLLNVALTTEVGKSNSHANIWEKYVNAIIQDISRQHNNVIFLLWGDFAKKKSNLIDDSKHHVLTWGHPSPLSPFNKTDNPKHFMYCDHFLKINDILKDNKIIWEIEDASPVMLTIHTENNENNESDNDKDNKRDTERENESDNDKDNKRYTESDNESDTEHENESDNKRDKDNIKQNLKKMYIATDGACTKNGKPGSKAAWAYYVEMINSEEPSDIRTTHDKGIVENDIQPGTNNRGELLAMINAAKYVSYLQGTYNIEWIYDSEYAHGCLTKWGYKWKKNNTTDKKNMDLIIPALNIFTAIMNKHNIKFIHVHSHQKKPENISSSEYRYWRLNDSVDKLCSELAL
jgi:uracil-DNA glycosylase